MELKIQIEEKEEKYEEQFRIAFEAIIASANEYTNNVIPAKAGIQLYHWMPDQESPA